MDTPNEWKCTVVFRVNATGGTGQAVYYVTAPNEGGAKTWARLQFMQDQEAAISGGSLIYLGCKAEIQEGDTQLSLI